MSEGLIYVMAGAIFVSTLALVLQLLILFGLYQTSKAVNSEVLKMLPLLRQLIESAEVTVVEGRKQMAEVTSRAAEILDLTRAQLVKVDESLGDVLIRLRGQLERAEMVVDDSLTKVHEAVSTVHSGVMKPLREVSGVAAGIRAAIQTLARGNRAGVAEVTHDDEMFI